MFQNSVHGIERQRSNPKIGEAARAIEEKNSLHRMGLSIVQKCRSECILYAVAFEKLLMLIIEKMDVIAGNVQKEHRLTDRINVIYPFGM